MIPSIQDVLHQVTEEILDQMQKTGWWSGPPKERVCRHDRPLPWDINCGMCESWAELAVQKLGAGDAIWIDQLIFWDTTDCEDTFHCVLRLEGLFYDSQCLEGVDDPRKLPIVLGVSRPEPFCPNSRP